MQSDFLQLVKRSVLKEKFIPKSNDLYDFVQTEKDLKASKDAIVQKFNQTLYSQEFRDFLGELTGIKLNDTIDLFAAIYKKTDKLLCHDDELEHRRIAFILYLVDDWTEEDGGTLDFFEMDQDNQPSHVINYIVPKWNRFAFFDVSRISYHQVGVKLGLDFVYAAEVLASKNRISLTGWFHSDPLPKPLILLEKPCVFHFFESFSFIIKDWINPLYLKSNMMDQICASFESADGSITLPNFLVDAKYREIMSIVNMRNSSNSQRFIMIPEGTRAYSDDQNGDFNWVMHGPANRRKYWKFASTNEANALSQCSKLITSKIFVLLLEKWTGLKLSGVMDADIRKFDHGGYTMNVDVDSTDQRVHAPGLDVCLVLQGSEQWSDSFGGNTQYITSDEVLASVDPLPNMLSIVLRPQPGQMHFVKYLNHTAPCSRVDVETTFLLDLEDLEKKAQEIESK